MSGPSRSNARGLGGGGIRRRGGSKEGGGHPRSGYNLMMMVDEYHNLQDRDPANHSMTALLLHDVPEWGLKAEFDQGVPLTKIRLTMPPSSNKDRRDIRGLSRPRGGGPAIDKGGIFAVEKCDFTPAADGGLPNITAGFASGLASSEELRTGLKVPMPSTMTAVLPEGRKPRSSEPSKRQTVISLLPDSAVLIQSPQDLMNFVGSVITEDPFRPGNPGVAIIANRVLPEDPAEAAAMAADPDTRYGQLVRAYPQNVAPEGATPEYRMMPPQRVIEKIAADQDMYSIIGNPEWQVTAIPVVHSSLAKSLVFSNQVDRRNPFDASQPYGVYTKAAPDTVREGAEAYPTDDGMVLTKLETGFANSIGLVTYMSADPNQRGIGMVTYERPVLNNGRNYATPNVVTIHDIQTPFTQPGHRQAIENICKESFQAGRAFMNKRWEAVKAAQPAPSAPQAPQGGYPQQPQGGYPQQPQGGFPQHAAPQQAAGGWPSQPPSAPPHNPQNGGWGQPQAQPQHGQPSQQGPGGGFGRRGPQMGAPMPQQQNNGYPQQPNTGAPAPQPQGNGGWGQPPQQHYGQPQSQPQAQPQTDQGWDQGWDQEPAF